MYEYISGTIVDKETDYVVCDAGGIGYLIYCSTNTRRELVLGNKEKLYIHFHVAEDANALYGFYTKDERDMFRKLISVTRIGKKTALGALSVMTPEDISVAVRTENAAAFDSVPGMGRKTAQRVILELKEKVDLLKTEAKTSNTDTENKNAMRSAGIEALISLGYDGLSAGRAVGSVKDEQFASEEELIRISLAVISGRK